MPAEPIRSAALRLPTLASRRALVGAALPLLAAIALASTCWAGRMPPSPAAPRPTAARTKSAPAPAARGTFVADGIRLPYLREGHGDVVVVLPDSAEGLETWRPQVASLGDRYLAVAYLRCGDTSTDATPGVRDADASDAVLVPTAGVDPAPAASHSTPDARQLRELLLVASSLTPGPIHLVGEGDGARIALRFALEHPERVRSLVLSAPDPRWFTTDADIGAARARTSIRSSADTMLACRRLWRIQVPVLVITGEHDWRTSGDTPPLRCVRLVREQLLRGAGMLPHVQASQDFNRAVARFLERQRMSVGEP